MIPTSVTSSSPPTACLGSIGNQTNSSPTPTGCAKSNNGANVGTDTMGGQGQCNNSAFLGIASLILEGRALAEDEYAIQATRYDRKTSLCGNTIECGRQSPKPSTSRAALGESNSSVVGNSCSLSIDLVNYLGRKASHSPESSSSSFLRDYYNNSSSSESTSSSVESNHSRWSQKLSQLRQESPNAHHQAMMARQKVAVECPRGSDAEYVALSINTDHHQYGVNEDKRGADFEILRRMSINQMNFYNSPNSMAGGGGSSGSGSSDNFMCSLQSLASNTCLRVGTPLLITTTTSPPPPPKYFNNRQISSSTPRFATPQYQQQLDYSIGTPDSSCSSSGVLSHCRYASSSPYSINSSSGNNSKSSTTTQRVANNKSLHSSSSSSNIFARYNYNCISPTAAETTMATTTATTTISSSSLATSRNKTHPQQGPHCDQFLRKMGLAKSDASEAEEHHCDMSYVSLACTRWRAYCIKMENILACGEPICIEVYLGPVNHKVLLEQWIITQKEKQPPPTMTLPSLCSAIRSQLYFSQISAWCDLIKKSDKTVKETGRVIYATPNTTTSAAGDLATTTNNAIMTATAPTATSATSIHHHTTSAVLALSAATTPSPGSGNTASVGSVLPPGIVGCGKRRTPSSPRLNIFYRIKQYDSTACFNSKPNIHNFPNVNISENCCISVCLKSLPRIAGGIPKVGTAAATATATTTATGTAMQQQNIPASSLLPVNSDTRMASMSKTYNAANAAKATTSSAAPTTAAAVNSAAAGVVVVVGAAATAATIANKSTILKMNCDNNLKEHQQQQKPFTASNSGPTNNSVRCSYLNNNKTNSKPSSGENANERINNQDMGDVDFECYNENRNSLDLIAGGDNTGISFGSDMVGDSSVGDYDSSNSSFSTNNCGSLSHREKQLLKYRKRMMKRDKKQQLRNQTTNQMRLSMHECVSNSNSSNSSNNNNHNNNNTNKENGCNKMEQGEEDDNDDDDDDDDDDLNVDDVAVDGDGDKADAVDNKSDNTADCCSERNRSVNNCLTKGQRQKQQLPKNHKNSIPYTNQNSQQNHHVKMISTGTQTITDTCTSCGSEKSMICLKCNPFKANNDDDDDDENIVTTTATITATTSTLTDFSYNYEEIMDAESSSSSASSLSSSDIIKTPRNKAELLLQAIQRTPKSNKKHNKHKSKDSNQMAAIKLQHQQQQNSPTTAIPTSTFKNSNNKNLRNSPQNFNTLNSDSRISLSHSNSRSSSSTSSIINGVVALNNSSSSNNIIGCQVCKRQKTQHNFNQPASEDVNSDDNNSLASSNSLSSPSSGNALLAAGKNANQNKSLTDDDKTADDDDNEKDGGKIFLGDCVDNISIVFDMDRGSYASKMSTPKSCDSFNQNEVMEEEYFETSTKLTPHIDRCSLNAKTTSSFQRSNTCGANGADNIEYGFRACSTPPLDEQKENSSKLEGGTTPSAQFKTPTPSKQHQNEMMKHKTLQPLQPHKHTLKPNLLHIAYNFNKADDQHIAKLSHDNGGISNAPANQNPLLLRRSLPKVNLTPIFCNTNSVMTVTSSPIPIVKGVCNGSISSNGLTIKSADINATKASPTFSFESPTSPAPSATVQKSNSAPTLPNSPSLSPRFVKASAIYKRRSRHLSDRSDRSSLGSDEQISDEDLDSGMYSPFATSPVKLRTRLSAVFGRKPLLGNLEESLLQRRLVPKIEVMGFKLLLGASGGFCPTQLTIPAAAYFYELKGETLSTPYMCEIRLPRKGYTVPRCGTVQATLLNPMGTVVRMFVIPYDMRDMPSYHQTFIRQRILADTGLQTNNENQQNGLDQTRLNDVIVSSGNKSSSSKVLKHQKLEQANRSEKQLQEQSSSASHQNQRSPQSNNEHNLGHFISAENMKSLRYSIHLRFQTSRTGRLMLHTDMRLLISRRTDCDTAAAHAKGVLEAPNELVTNTMMPKNPKYSARQDQTSSKI